MRVTIEKIVYPGRSLSRIQDKVVFTDEGLPQETVEIEMYAQKKRFSEARTLSVVASSPHRVKPRCTHYKICSPYQYIDYPAQIAIKKEQLQEMFSRQLNKGLPAPAVYPSDRAWGYRNKITLGIRWTEKTPAFTYHLPDDPAHLIEIDACALMSDSCNRFLKQLQKRLQQTGMTQLDGTVVRESSSTHELLVELTANAPLEAGYLKGHFADMERESPLLRGIVVTHPQGTIVIGQDSLTENIEGHSFQIGSGCFFQINGSILGQALRHIRSALGLTEHETLADLYSGIGTFGIACAQKTASVIAVENNPRNIALLRRNCLINSLRNITIIDRDVEIWLRQRHIPRCDAMLVDPPRKGLDPQVSKSLLRHTPSRIYYLSCNPATLLRDLIILTQRYAIKDIALFDFFPHTPHIETGVLLHLR